MSTVLSISDLVTKLKSSCCKPCAWKPQSLQHFVLAGSVEVVQSFVGCGCRAGLCGECFLVANVGLVRDQLMACAFAIAIVFFRGDFCTPFCLSFFDV